MNGETMQGAAHTARWPEGSGEMARRIRGLDWAATPLGPLERWPQSLRTIVDVILDSPLAMAALWGEHLVQIYNERFAELFGARHPAALGTSARAVAAETGPIDVRHCERVLVGQTRTGDGVPLTEVGPNGPASSAFRLSHSPLRGEQGNIAGVLVTAVETSARQQESEQHLRLAMAASAAGAWSWNARTNETTWDDCYHAMYGFAADAPRRHEAWLDRIHPADRPRVEARLDAVTRTLGDDEWNMEFRAVTPDRGVVWMQGLGRAVRDAAGAVVSMTGINLDVTARKGVEQQLRDSEAKLRLFFENAPAAIAMLDRDMRYLAISRRGMQDFGLTGDILGRCHYDVFPDIPERWREVHRRCLAGAVERAEEDRFDRADGSRQWLRWEVLPWRDAAGAIGGIIILTEDITDQRRWRESQQVLIAELQHRTRNLITVVEAIAQQTQREAASLETFMTQFSVRLRALARVQSLLSRSDRVPITIGALVRMELDALGPAAIGARTLVAGPDVRLRKRSVQTLALAIHELATNACKYGALAGASGRLSVTWRIEDAGDGRRQLVLEWVETDIGQRLGNPDPRGGYGRTLIERALPYSLSAQTTFDLRDEAFRCSIRLPVDLDEAHDVVG